MKILLVASECAPYYSTGGLADVVCGLAKELTNRLEDVRILVPRYRRVLTQLPNLERVVEDMRVDLGSSLLEGDEQGAYSRNANILKSSGTPPIYFVEQEFYFGRDRLYGYPDDYERFIFFGLAALSMLRDATFRSREGDWFPDIIQGYDWATGLMPGWLRHCTKRDPRFNAVRFVLNIHNPRRMGIFGSRSLQLAKQDREGIYQEIGEKDERVNFLGRGILFADKIVTVNPRFDDPEAAGGNPTALSGPGRKASRNPLPEPARILKQALTQRLQEGDLVGIRNGIDEEDYDPGRKAPALASQFGPSSLNERLKNKLALQRTLGLVPDEHIPLLGMVSRLIPVNGFQLLQTLHDNLKELGKLQLAVLAAGGPSDSSEMLRRWEEEQDAKAPWIKSRFIRDPNLARLIYAGCDIYLIPARELPSGISQFIAMRYGAVPLAYHTGALCDSVEDCQEWSKLPLGLNSGIGFKFYEYSDRAFLKTVKDALAVYARTDPAAWRHIQLHNMRQHFNWAQPATDYLELYQTVLEDESTPIREGTRPRLNHEARLLQAILEVDNLPGLGARNAQEILKQAGRIIRGVLRCDAIYVWDMEQNLGGEIIEVSLDRTRHPIEPSRDEVARLLNQGAAEVWGPLGDMDLSGICRPIAGLVDSKLAQNLGWQVGRSLTITAHGRLLGRIDALLTKTPDREEDEWQTMALTVLASAFGQRLHALRGAKELDTVHELASRHPRCPFI
jgi:starch synthase